MKDLSKNELISINGGHVPVGYYMDDDVIRANVKAMDFFGSFFLGFFTALFD